MRTELEDNWAGAYGVQALLLDMRHPASLPTATYAAGWGRDS